MFSSLKAWARESPTHVLRKYFCSLSFPQLCGLGGKVMHDKSLQLGGGLMVIRQHRSVLWYKHLLSQSAPLQQCSISLMCASGHNLVAEKACSHSPSSSNDELPWSAGTCHSSTKGLRIVTKLMPHPDQAPWQHNLIWCQLKDKLTGTFRIETP